MPRKNRAYKKREPHRDARLFVIVAEGEREDAYFRYFEGKSLRLRIKIVPRKENRSAPNHFLERLQQFQEAGEWMPDQDDQLWFVLDVDCWKREQVEELRSLCQQFPNWQIAISNSCFEVWLLYHFTDQPVSSEQCQPLKQQLHQVSNGASSAEDCTPLIHTAIAHASHADQGKATDYPDEMCTKVYLLAQAMSERLGAIF
jgi:hypothetical protein